MKYQKYYPRIRERSRGKPHQGRSEGGGRGKDKRNKTIPKNKSTQDLGAMEELRDNMNNEKVLMTMTMR